MVLLVFIYLHAQELYNIFNMMYWLIPLIIGLVLLAVFLVFRVKEKRVVAVVIKGFVSLMFIATALVAWLTSANPNSSFGIFVLMGLSFGLLGDVFLDIKFITKQYELMFTILGFFAFAFGHICYASGLLIHFFDFTRNVFYIIVPVISGLALMILTLLMEKFTAVRYENMKPYVCIYGFALFFTVSIFLSAAIQNGWQVTTVNIMFFALISFALSDLILNNTYFAPGFSGPAFIISNHVLYYVGQFAIAVSLFYLL